MYTHDHSHIPREKLSFTKYTKKKHLNEINNTEERYNLNRQVMNNDM